MFQYNHSFAQTNLVPNGSFEDNSTCPIENMLSNTGINIVDGWFSIVDDIGTPDYYHTCNNSLTGIVGVPNNLWGNQLPFQGNAFVGIVVEGYGTPGDSAGFSEYIQCKLATPLITCVKYKISFNVSLAENSSYAFSNIGALFTTDTLKRNFGPSLISKLPSLVSSKGFLNDTLTWVNISGIYTATGGERFMTIGYLGDIKLDTMYIKPSVNGWNYPYSNYYIDSVNLTEIESCENFPNVFTPNGDGINDLIDFTSISLYDSEISVYNRWGEHIFKTSKDNKLWDGKNSNGIDCNEGVYFYLLISNKEKIKNNRKGFIQLVR